MRTAASRAAMRGNPLNRRRLPPISATTAFGGARPALGVNVSAHVASCASARASASTVAIAGAELRRERERRGNQLAGTDAGLVRRRIRRDDTRIVAAAADDERMRGVIRRLRAREDVERQRREDEAGPQHDGHEER